MSSWRKKGVSGARTALVFFQKLLYTDCMCFVIPLQITATHGTTATLENALTVDIGSLESCGVGDYVIVTSGIAVAKVDVLDAKAMRSQIKETYDELS